MKRVFNYNHFGDQTADSLVETFNQLVNASIENKNNTKEYKELNQSFTENFMAHCVEAIPNMTFSGLDMVRNPMVHKDLFFLQRFNTILAQAITPAVPTVSASEYERLYDVTQVGFGVAKAVSAC